jgi:hypothetical protein
MQLFEDDDSARDAAQLPILLAAAAVVDQENGAAQRAKNA